MASQYGSRFMPTVVDEIAKDQPDLEYAYIPLTSNVRDGFKPVTFAEIANATNSLVSWIETNIGRSLNFETIAYISSSDLRYVVAFLAAVKCGYKVRSPKFLDIAIIGNYSMNTHTGSTSFGEKFGMDERVTS